MRSFQIFGLIFILAIYLLGCDISVNRSIHIRNGEIVRHSLNSVNGSVIVGSNCVIKGNCRSVNGRVAIGRNSDVSDLQSVNGRILVESNVTVDGDIESVNGSITCDQGVKIRGRISSINGSIDLDSTQVRRNIVIYNGNITISKKSVVQRDIVIKGSKSRSNSRRSLKIRIEDGSVVEGDIMVRDEDKKVEVYLSNGGKVSGRIEGAEVYEE
jgi:DUF4097 and DUF4098 domain-containing protein YvlB